MKSAVFDKSVRIWFELYFVLVVIGTLLINRLPLLLDNRNPLYLFFWFVAMVIGCLKAIRVKLAVDSEYRAVEIVETRRGINLYLRNYWRPIYVPFKWLKIKQSDENNDFILSYDKAIQFRFGKALLVSGNQVEFSEKYFVFEEMSDIFDVIANLQKDPNVVIDYDKLNPVEKNVTKDKWRTAKFFPWILLGTSLVSVILTAIISDEFFSPSPYTLQMETSLNSPNYHRIYDYSKGMTISTNFYKFKILHAYKVQEADTDDDYIVLNINAKTASEYATISDGNFMSFDNWSMKAEKDSNEIDDANNNEDLVIKTHGRKKGVINMLRSGWDGSEGNDNYTFNVALKKASGRTDIVYAGFQAILSKSKHEDTSFVLKINPNDLEKI